MQSPNHTFDNLSIVKFLVFGTNKKNMAQWMQSHNSKKTIPVLLFPVLGLVNLISYLQPLFTLQKQNFLCTSLLTMLHILHISSSLIW